MLKCDQPEKPRKTYVIPKVSKKRAAEIAAGAFKPKSPKPIKVNKEYKMPTRSKRRAAQERQYLNVTRPAYLKQHSRCEAKVMCMGAPATEIHHKEGRIEERLNDTGTFIALCLNCHRWAENNVTAAKELNISNDRL